MLNWEKFGRRIMGYWLEGYDVDVIDVQDIALECGLLKGAAFDSEIHGDAYCFLEPGDPWYELTYTR